MLKRATARFALIYAGIYFNIRPERTLQLRIEKAPEKRKVCKVGCIGCRKCAKYAPDKFTIEGFLASVNYEAQVLPVREDLDNIKCPTGALLSAEEHHYIEKHNPAWEKSEK